VSHSSATSPAGWQGGAIRYFGHIDGLVVTGNIQPLPSGTSFAKIYDSTSVTYH
jgi:hypothetical protein